MLVARFFTGVAGSAFLSVAGGTVGDIFERHELAAPMMVYTASPFMGPELGPLYVFPSMIKEKRLTHTDWADLYASLHIGQFEIPFLQKNITDLV